MDRLCDRSAQRARYLSCHRAENLFGDKYPLGIPTITVLVLFTGGVQLTAVGVLGEYIGRIYDEVRRRPLYIVDRAVNVSVRTPADRVPVSERHRSGSCWT